MKIYKFMSLYHYCEGKRIPNKYTEQCIKTQAVYFNDWEKLNDPMEGFYRYIPKEHERNIEQILSDQKREYKIFCCSKEYSNILMWSHYADCHNGICLEIEVDEKRCHEQAIFHVNIEYKKNLITIFPTLTTKDQIKHILKHKLSKWKYEKEIRFFVKNSHPDSFRIGDITSILLGSRYEENHQRLLKEWAGDVNIKTMIFNSNTNQMEVQ